MTMGVTRPLADALELVGRVAAVSACPREMEYAGVRVWLGVEN